MVKAKKIEQILQDRFEGIHERVNHGSMTSMKIGKGFM